MLMKDSLRHAAVCQLAPAMFLLAPHGPLMGFVPASDTPADPDRIRRQKLWFLIVGVKSRFTFCTV